MKNLHFTEISFSEAIKRGEDFFEEANGQHMLSDFKAERIPMGGGYNSYQVTFVLDGLGLPSRGPISTASNTSKGRSSLRQTT